MNKRARGFTLVEVLVSMVVLSVGLLGASAMLLESLRGHAQALRRAAATGLVRDLADRIRANARGGAFYDTRRSPIAAANCDSVTPCDSSQLAAADLAHFATAARALMPRGEVLASSEFEPAIGPAASDRVIITLRWRAASDPADVSEEISLQLLAAPVAG